MAQRRHRAFVGSQLVVFALILFIGLDAEAQSGIPLATGLRDPHAITVDGTNVYWVESGDGVFRLDVKKVQRNGGTSSVLATVPLSGDSVGIAVDSTSVYWSRNGNGTTNGELYKTATSSAAAAPSPLVQALNQPTTVRVDSTHLYWVETNCGSPGLAGVRRVPIDGGPIETLTNSGCNFRGLALDSQLAYFAYIFSPAICCDYRIARIPKANLSSLPPINLSPSLPELPNDLAIDSTSIYWVEFTAGTVKRMPLTGGDVTTLATGLNQPTSLTVDPTHVYWTELANGVSGAGSVKRLPKEGGVPPELLATGITGPFSIAVDQGELFWSEVGSIQTTEPDGAIKKLGLASKLLCEGDFDYGDVAVLFVPQELLSTGGDGKPQVDLAGVTKRFFCSHQDNFQFLTIFSTFVQSDEGVGGGSAFYEPIYNSIRGLGPVAAPDAEDFDPGDAAKNYCCFDFRAPFATARLDGIINMKSVEQWPNDPQSLLILSFRALQSTLDVLGQEFAHRWGAYVRFTKDSALHSKDLLDRPPGGIPSHWSFFLDSAGSVLLGNDWRSIRQQGRSLFVSTGVTTGYSPLDLYLMGLYQAEEVPAFFYVKDGASLPSLNYEPWSAPSVGAIVTGTRINVSIKEVIASVGARNPSANESPKEFRQAFVLLVPQGLNVGGEVLSKVERIRSQWVDWFTSKSQRRGSIDTRLNN